MCTGIVSLMCKCNALMSRVMGSDSESEKDDENDMDEPDPLERPKKRAHDHDSTRAQVRNDNKALFLTVVELSNHELGGDHCRTLCLQKRAKTNGSGEKQKEGGQKRKRQAKVMTEEVDTGTEDLIGMLPALIFILVLVVTPFLQIL